MNQTDGSLIEVSINKTVRIEVYNTDFQKLNSN